MVFAKRVRISEELKGGNAAVASGVCRAWGEGTPDLRQHYPKAQDQLVP